MKWDMGWMHDTLEYMKLDPIHRKFHHDKLTFRGLYAFSENYVLPLSHDEVVHLKGSLLTKMPGDDWQRLANLRLLFAWMWAQPGKKLLFMGGEIGQWREWNHDAELDWGLLENRSHAGLQSWVRDLNRLYAQEPALHERDFEPAGFSWIDCTDFERSVVAVLRRGRSPENVVAAAFNFTPVPRYGYRIGLPTAGFWRELANSDAVEYGGSGVGNLGGCETSEEPAHGHPYSTEITLPPLGAVFFKPYSRPAGGEDE
jgi:1,4-alpha-glucan branching enzyme